MRVESSIFRIGRRMGPTTLDSRSTDPVRIDLARPDLESDPQITQQRSPCFCVVHRWFYEEHHETYE